ncbi:hypothetical protein ONE63_003124 [Megalurothrips usitatus]|uniref:Uncharacterized protein n=1 Tax=Megalurothrips usitatus TaxID=439358 RepID=A0AAV7X742_9NEOP|nr:hypothetical protein ONE63_003124 [Megalurothrips usitatus]
MEERVRLFNEKTKGFMEAARKGPLVSARNVTFSKFTNVTIRSTNEIGVVELVFAGLSPSRRLCMDKSGKKTLSSKRRQPGCLFRECVDGMYFFYLTRHARPRLVGFHGREQFNPLGPPRCCDLTRGPGGEDGEHLVPDGHGRYSCQRRRAPRAQVDYFFFLKKRQENATLADAIPAHNHRQGGHNRLPGGGLHGGGLHGGGLHGGGGGDGAEERPHHRRPHPRHRGPATSTTAEVGRHRHNNHPRPEPPPPQPQPPPQPAQPRPHRTRHHHHLTPLYGPERTPRPAVRVRHRKVAPPQTQAASNHLIWD